MQMTTQTLQLPVQPLIKVNKSLGEGGQAYIYQATIEDMPVALKVYDRKSVSAISPRNEFDILQRLQDCPFILQSLAFYTNA